MFNPQLMGLNNFENIPTTKDLWKNEKEKYRHWIIIFGLSLFVILAFSLTSFILNLLDKELIIQKLILNFQKENDAIRRANGVWNTSFLVLPSLILGSITIGLGMYIWTIFEAYHKHSFARISVWSIYIFGVGAIFSFIAIFLNLTQGNVNFTFRGTVFDFINRILFIVIYFSAATKVGKIRRLFAYSEYVEKLKKDEKFIQFQEHLKGSIVNKANNDQNVSPLLKTLFEPNNALNQKQTSINNVKADDLKSSAQYQKLNAMELTKLVEIAERFSISGSNLMEKEELITTIIRVSSNKH